MRTHVPSDDRTKWDLDVSPQTRSKSLTLGAIEAAIISGLANHRVGRLKTVVNVYVKHCPGESNIENARAVNPRLRHPGRSNICKMSAVTDFITRPEDYVFARHDDTLIYHDVRQHPSISCQFRN